MAVEPHIAEDDDVIYIDPFPSEGINMGNLNLVGKIIADKEIRFNSIKATLMGIWGHPRGVAVTEVDRNKMLISFNDHDKELQVLNIESWSIRGHLLNLQIWTGADPIDTIDHNYMELWMQMHGVPLSYMTRFTTEIIGKNFVRIGESKDPVAITKRSVLNLQLPLAGTLKGLAASGLNNGNAGNNENLHEDKATSHCTRSKESQEEGHHTSRPNLNMPEVGGQNQNPTRELLNLQPQQPDNTTMQNASSHGDGANSLWNYRDRTRMKRTFNDKEKKIVQRTTSVGSYKVEFLDDDEVMQDLSPNAVPEGTWEIELIQEITHSMQIKRKREETCQLLIESDQEDAFNISPS
ncbi:hypothetical protein PIB30_038527 [Stylosanthes scabra]|uniref:DUF4283 domain-containing protein n=1 Tax=Stylosanthes scabra TaxID=79078 RepID=A0ABU6VBY0_9FABA|nr:hypothetical protein [Stylosanthes scabra]